MSNLSLVMGNLVGVFGFLFLFWKRTKEDYTSEQIFSFGFVVSVCLLSGFLIGNFLNLSTLASNVFVPSGLWFWLAFLSGCLGFAISLFYFKLRFFETLEAVGIGFLFWFFAVCLSNVVVTHDIKLIIYLPLQLLLIVFFFFLDKKYKSFSWYKSGKVGFAGLTVLGLFFLSRTVIALIAPNMISFIGKFDAVLSSIASFAFFISLYNLSGL